MRDDLPELLAHAEENGQVTGLITDGLIFGDTAKLEALLQTGLDHVIITLNTDHTATWTALANALAADLFVAVHLTISLLNALEAGKILNKIAQSGVKYLSLSIDDLSLQDTLLELRNTAAELNLSLTWDMAVPYSAFNPIALEIQEDTTSLETTPTSLYVEPDGDVLPAQGVNLVLGNLLTDPWERIWQ